jgi:hypothetical protein
MEIIHKNIDGWYYWDETFSFESGPFDNKELCEIALKYYCENLVEAPLDGNEYKLNSLLGLLRHSKHPNCTLYLIWFYLNKGDVEQAKAEFTRDSDKLGIFRKYVEELLNEKI